MNSSYHTIMLPGKSLDALLFPVIQILCRESLFNTLAYSQPYVTTNPITNIIFFLHINPPTRLADTQFLFLADSPNPPVVLFVSNGRGGREEERAGYHGRYEWQAKERKGMFTQRRAIAGCNVVRICRRAKLLVSEDGHCGDRGLLDTGLFED